ncbi:MAG: hypothetical protein ACPG5U_10425 [Planktomarina sp.]
MVAPDLSSMTKVISKTKKSQAEPYTFDLTLVPDLRNMLASVPVDRRFGPLIRMPNGDVPKQYQVSKRFKAIVRKLGLPDHLQIRDCRSDGITEACSLVDPMTLRNSAQHSQVSTTDRYVRGRSSDANTVVALRQKNAS